MKSAKITFELTERNALKAAKKHEDLTKEQIENHAKLVKASSKIKIVVYQSEMIEILESFIKHGYEVTDIDLGE